MGQGEKDRGTGEGHAPSAAWPQFPAAGQVAAPPQETAAPAAPPRETARRRSGPAPGELVGVEGARIEGLLGLASGLVFGFVGTSLGHPADTVKTKMQVDPQFSGRSAAFVFRTTVRREGFLARVWIVLGHVCVVRGDHAHGPGLRDRETSRRAGVGRRRRCAQRD